MDRQKELLKIIEEFLTRPALPLPQKEVLELVRSFLARRDIFAATAQRKGSPLYVFDKVSLAAKAEQYVSAFVKTLGEVTVFYAVKSNNHPLVMQTLVECGLGLDVSSGIELAAALTTGCSSIVLSGPGKTAGELALAVDHADRVTVLLDRFGELARLEKTASTRNRPVRAGVRLTTNEQGLWRKFGIPLSNLQRFLGQAEKCPHVTLRGIQFHTSWNLNPQAQIDFITRLGEVIKRLSKKQRSIIEFLDIGGGYWPPAGEWLQPGGTNEGRIRQVLDHGFNPGIDHYKLEAEPLAIFAESLCRALRSCIFPWITCEIYMEPGRWLSNEA